MLLSTPDLRAALTAGLIDVDPHDPGLLQPASIDLRLDRQFRTFNNHTATHIDPLDPDPELTTLHTVTDAGVFVLHPGEFVLASTLEVVTLSTGHAGRFEGKSSLGRCGLLTHSTAGFIDPGFSGHITLELSNVANLPITLHPGMRIGQMCVFWCSSPADHPYGHPTYGSRYQHQRGPTPARPARTPAPETAIA